MSTGEPLCTLNGWRTRHLLFTGMTTANLTVVLSRLAITNAYFIPDATDTYGGGAVAVTNAAVQARPPPPRRVSRSERAHMGARCKGPRPRFKVLGARGHGVTRA